jgi:O-acetyl-ADP-ribose deacetylase (regulator of RNase III)
MLTMSGGVSAMIASLASTSIRDEVALDLPLPVGTIAVTSGGKLPIRYIIHAVTVDWHNNVFPTQRTIRQLIRGILSRCEALRIERIAIPALATGAAGLEPIVSVEALARCLREHTVSPTILKSIVLPIPDPAVFRVFASVLAIPASEEVTSADSSSVDLNDDLNDDPATQFPDSSRISSIPAASPKMGGWLTRLLRGTPTFDVDSTLGASTAPDPKASVLVPALESRDSSRPLLSGRYVLLEEIGRGGMAVVHLAWDLVMQSTVAIKMLQPDCTDPQSLKREASAAFALTHDAIVRLYHFEPARSGAELPYLVMEYVAWPSGEKWIADAGESALPVRAVRDVGVRVCDALAYAHNRNILHLDIKPANIFVDQAGECAKLGDFGLARLSSPGGAALQGRPIGTPAYMAPEQRVPGARVTSATDVYQMAATLWDFLTGSPPRAPQLETEHLASDRGTLLAVLLQALAQDPASRPTAIRLRDMVKESATT